MSGFSLRVPVSSPDAGSGISDFRTNYRLAHDAVRRGSFDFLQCPPLFQVGHRLGDLDCEGVNVRPEITYRAGVAHHEKVVRLLTRLQPQHALIVGGEMVSSGPGSETGELLSYLLNWRQQGNLPGLHLWGEFNLNLANLDNLAGKLAVGLSGFTTPAPLPTYESRRAFERKLEELNARGFDSDMITVGVPYIPDEDSLLALCRLARVDPADDPELQILLEQFRAARRDHRLGRFAEQWNEGQISYYASMPGINGIDFKPVTPFDTAVKVFGRATEITTVPVNRDFLDKNRYLLAEFVRDMSKLGINVVPEPIISSELKLPGKIAYAYAEKCVPFFNPILEAFRTAQQDESGRELCRNLRVKIERPTTKVGKPLMSIAGIYANPEDFDKGIAPESYEISINLLALGKADHASAVNQLSRYIEAFKAGTIGPDDIEKLNNGPKLALSAPERPKSVLLQVGREGWNHYDNYTDTALITAKGAAPAEGSKVLFPTAELEGFIEICANQIEEALLRDKSENPVYIEPGCFRAHGVKELFAVLQKRAEQNPALAERLSKMTFLFSDFSQKALDTCSEALKDRTDTTGIKCEFVVLDSEQTLAGYEPYKGRIIGGRCINVFDAFDTEYYATINEKFHRVVETTYLNKDILRKLMSSEWTDHRPGSVGNFRFVDTVNFDRVLDILNNDTPEFKRVEAFITYLRDECEVPVHRAKFLWGEIFRGCLEQKIDYVRIKPEEYTTAKDSNGNSLGQIIKEAVGNNPGDYIAPDSINAIYVIDGIMSIMNPGSQFVTSQLTGGAPENRSRRHRYCLYDLTTAIPVNPEILRAWSNANNIEFQRIPGRRFKSTDTNSAMIFQNRF